MKVVATNRKARRDYQVIETFEAGIELRGCEVKSLRTQNCSLEDSFARLEKGELFLYSAHIADFVKSSFFKTEPKRTRKLLVHKQQLHGLIGQTTQRGFSLIPLKMYFNDRGIAKVELALVKGKHSYDKRRKLREDISRRETDRVLKQAYKKYA